MKTAAVLLNYNDAEATIAAAERIKSFSSIDEIIILDNASADDSLERLMKEYASAADNSAAEPEQKKISLLKNSRNGGYGYGNNRGVKYAAEHCGAELVLIANPDAYFTEELVLAMREAFASDDRLGAAGAVMELQNCDSLKDGQVTYEEFIRSGWCERSFGKELIASAPVLKRIFKGKINYSDRYYREESPLITVYAVHGSLVMVRTGAFLDCGGFDESMFLYMEEYALAARLKKAGFRTVLLSKTYRHEGSHSISGAGNGAVRRQRLRQASERIYYKKYLGAGCMGMLAAGLLQKAVLLETCIFAGLRAAGRKLSGNMKRQQDNKAKEI